MPARAQAQDMSMIVDLDDMLSKPVGFRFRGVLYRVEPVTTETFLRISTHLSEAGQLLQRQKDGEVLTDVQVYEAYQKFIAVLVPTFKVDVLRQMQIPQVHALINLIIKHATGQPMNLGELSEKKKLTLNLPL
jgi:hypothetical protein